MLAAQRRRSIAFFMHNLAGGGVERMRLRLIAELQRRGYNVTLIVQHLSGPLCAALPPDLRVVSLNASNSGASVMPLAAAIDRLRPDFLISSLDHNNVVALCAARLSSAHPRVVVCQHNALSMERWLGWRYRLIPILYRLLSPLADSIVAVSYGVADDLAQMTGIARKRISVVSNPVFDSRLSHDHHREEAGACGWLAEPDIPMLVFVGRLVEQKDPALLLRAFALACRQTNARLAILGEGELQTALMQQAAALGIADRVLFAGFVSEPAAWIRAASALVLTSRYEGLGNVIIEALSLGTPVIATNCPHGPAEILAHGQFGVLVAPGDEAALAAAMCRDLKSAFPADMLRGRAAAYSVQSCADRHEDIFRRARYRNGRRPLGLHFCEDDARAVASDCIEIPADRPRLVVTPNLDHVRLLRQAEFAAAYDGADIVCADGFPVALYAWLRGTAALHRVTGCAILHHLLRHQHIRTKSVMAVVESAETMLAVQQWLTLRNLRQHWHVVVAPPRLGTDTCAQEKLIDAIRCCAPDVLLMTLGAPTSEVFVHRHKQALPPCWVLCVGQALRVELGLVKRAPGVWRVAGLEWAWRALHEPWRLLPRYFKAAAWFPIAIAHDLRSGRNPGRRGGRFG
jgi:exopolysaccharide biosynthesis WecB/TagA/CpsF family protein